jgi:predicted ester cyclase
MTASTLTIEDMRSGHIAVIQNVPVAAARWVDENYLHHDPLTPETEAIRSREQYVVAFDVFKEAVPDQITTAEHVIVEGDYSAARWRFTGTHTGKLRGMEPTNNKIDYYGMTMYRWENGKIVEGWTLFDVIGFYGQLGIGGLG